MAYTAIQINANRVSPRWQVLQQNNEKKDTRTRQMEAEVTTYYNNM